MAIEGLDAMLPVETTAFLPQVALASEMGADRGPTLDSALADAGLDERSGRSGLERLLDRDDSLIQDLWLSPGFHPPRRLEVDHDEAPTPLRKLTGDEMALIAGGSGSDMNGEGDSIPGATVYGWPYWDWNFPNNDPGEQYPTGSGSPGGTDFNQELENQCEVDNKVDFAAQQVANLIKTMPDWNEREYAAIIYMTTDGEIHATPLIRGQTVAEALALGLIAPETHLTAPPDLGGGVILAVVHSHPDIGYGAAGDLENHYPSDRPTSGDYYAFEQLAGHDSRFANNAAFAQYILGPDGLLREFNAKDGRINPTNDTNPASRTNLAADRPCG
jgi:hypothetical protein